LTAKLGRKNVRKETKARHSKKKFRLYYGHDTLKQITR